MAIPLIQESENITNHGSGLLDKKPSILGREANTDVAIPLIQATTPNPGNTGPTKDLQDHIIVNGKLQYLGKGMQEGGERNTDVRIPLYQMHTPSIGDNHWMGYNHTGEGYNASPSSDD